MEENKKVKKNHWTQSNVDNAAKKINNEIFKRNRQAPLSIKLDDLSVYINEKITRRGISKGLVCIQEDMNINILKAEKKTIEALISNDLNKQQESLLDAKRILKIEVWPDIRFLMINKAITPGEITELIRRQLDIDKDIDKWSDAIEKAISADR